VRCASEPLLRRAWCWPRGSWWSACWSQSPRWSSRSLAAGALAPGRR